jgi:hypothetical protein
MAFKLVATANGSVVTSSGSGGRQQKQRTRTASSAVASWLKTDKALFFIFLTSVIFVSISIFIVVPLISLDDATTTTTTTTEHHTSPERQKQSHSISVQLEKKSSSALVVEKLSSTKTVGDNINLRDRNINSDNSDNDEDFFRTNSSPYHTIFSTGCSIFQDWQSYVFFYHVMQSGQEGHVTRISSGCSAEDEKKLKAVFSDEIKSMRADKNHHLHLTPDFSLVPKKDKKAFKYFNKPFGVRHWMENALGYPDNHKLHDDSIIILMDPDQIMLRPFTNDFTNSSEKWKLKEPKYKLKVEHGSPFSQQFGYGIQWLTKVDPEYVFKEGRLPTPVSNISRSEAYDYYMAMGPVSNI